LSNLSAQTTVKVRPLFNGKEVQLKKGIVSSKGDTLSFSTLRFYISKLSIYDALGNGQRTDPYYLVDLENEESLILFSGSAGIQHISFYLGTDSLTNVSGILEGPLDPINGMYWAWNSGYINFKLEGTSSHLTTPKKEFEFHLGGYLEPFPTVRSFDFSTNSSVKMIYIDIDIEKWLNTIDLTTNSNVMIPGKTSFDLMDELQKCIAISYAE
jgi:hypothetical protein